ncbi:UPF0262 family protein (plasmid) [Sinorhizobium garamanticum]|uniref:UPF0262 family protein n=1 Tax=Sinorhizobium garamanticum TaxID=680247 RepID=A0ABY8DNU5_9HYPH|nr:UPF0262 family protein [Sinorhizobium garamanticum]WEX91808.1 UPF0262 family protein [Sinorhizobium garamanticum]
MEREQALAIIDLLESNSFTPIGHDGGPLSSQDRALHATDNNGVHVVSHYVSLTPCRRLLKDYTRICESYYDAMCRPRPERLEAIDMGRRGIHNEAAELLRERLSIKVRIDQGHGASPVHGDLRAHRTQSRTSDSVELNSYATTARKPVGGQRPIINL